MNTTTSNATEVVLVNGRGSQYIPFQVEVAPRIMGSPRAGPSPSKEEGTGGGVQTNTTSGDATEMVLANGRGSTCMTREVERELSEEEGTTGGVQMNTTGSNATEVVLVNGRSSKWLTQEVEELPSKEDGTTDTVQMNTTTSNATEAVLVNGRSSKYTTSGECHVTILEP